MGDSRHTQYTQIGKVIGENEKNVSFILWKKTSQTIWQPNMSHGKSLDYGSNYDDGSEEEMSRV